MYNPDTHGVGNLGWCCPRCFKCFSPYITECPYCGGSKYAKTNWNTPPATEVKTSNNIIRNMKLEESEISKKNPNTPTDALFDDGYGLPAMNKI